MKVEHIVWLFGLLLIIVGLTLEYGSCIWSTTLFFNKYCISGFILNFIGVSLWYAIALFNIPWEKLKHENGK